MCFSAAASFVGGAIVSSIGVVTVRMNREPSKRFFASIPLLFGVQQISEGAVWLALQTPGFDTLLKVSVYIYLTMALVVWPTAMPLSLFLMEKAEKKRRVLYVFSATGMVLSMCYLTAMLIFEATIQISNYHILYYFDSPQQLTDAAFIFYLIVTIPPLFISSIKRVYVLGIAIALSYVAAYLFFSEYLVSVWCFFAAMLSVIIWWILKDQEAQIVEPSPCPRARIT